jgi:hypothetical protein
MIGQLRKTEAGLPGERVLHRIAALTLGFGFASAALALALHRPDWAKGLAGGALLGWLNFRWLSRGIRAMMLAVSSHADVPSSDPEASLKRAKLTDFPVGTYLALVFRYALVAFGAYVIFIYLHVPLVSIGLGLCALVAAIMTASVWEVLKSES